MNEKTYNLLSMIGEQLQLLGEELKKLSLEPGNEKFLPKEIPFEEPAAKEKKEEKPAVSLAMLRNVLTPLAANGKREEVQKLILDIGGVKKLSEVPEDKYAELYEKAKALGGD